MSLIRATESAVRNNKIGRSRAIEASSSHYQCKKLQKIKAVTSLSRDEDITILPADKGRRTVVFNTADYHAKIMTFLNDSPTYEALKRDPTSDYKPQITNYQLKLEKDKVM